MTKSTILIALTTSLLLTACAKPDMYKQAGTGNWWGFALGFKEEKIASNKWFISFLTQYDTSKAEALKLLYRRAEEVGKQQCKKGHTTDTPEVKRSEYGITSSIILHCKE